MEKGYKHLAYFLGLLIALTLIGFYKRYFSLAPNFHGLRMIHHFHATVLLLWLFILVLQPILITQQKIALHKAMGKFTYFLVPVILVSMLLAYHSQYHRFIAEGQSEAFVLGFIFSPATDSLPFVILYLLAILHKKDTPKHMRYMITTGIIIGGPGLARIFMTWLDLDVFVAIQILFVFLFFTFISLILYDRILKKNFRINPYTIAFLIWLVPNILIMFFPQTSVWQNFAKWIVTTW